jgi:DNA-directed RNA polymerase specialized sigma24 family protein
MEMLFDNRTATAPLADARGSELPPPTVDELGAAALAAAQLVVNKLYFGGFPTGMQRQDLVQEVVIAALPRCAKWRPGGSKNFQSFCYWSARNALMDWCRERKKHAADPDVLDSPDTLSFHDAGLGE